MSIFLLLFEILKSITKVNNQRFYFIIFYYYCIIIIKITFPYPDIEFAWRLFVSFQLCTNNGSSRCTNSQKKLRFDKMEGFDDAGIFFSDNFGGDNQQDANQINLQHIKRKFKDLIRTFNEDNFHYKYR